MTGRSQRERFALSTPPWTRATWGRRLPWGALHLEQARVVDLRREPDFRPRRRRAGTALPGYQSGWFRLANGQRALLFVTAWHRVLYVPTSAGYALLLSPQDPEAMLDALRRRAGRRSGS
jgi:hypothetical protein